jgi:(p)ppGpp synthase/HD superfamily hydrolase
MLTRNERGVLALVAQTFAKHDVNIDEFTAHSQVDGRTQMDCTAEVRNAVQLYQLIDELRKLPAVFEVVRSGGDT